MKRHTRYAVQYSKGQYSVVEYTTVLTAALRATGEPAHQVTLSHRRHAINPLRGGAVQSAVRVRVCQCGTLQYSPPPAHHVPLSRRRRARGCSQPISWAPINPFRARGSNQSINLISCGTCSSGQQSNGASSYVRRAVCGVGCVGEGWKSLGSG